MKKTEFRGHQICVQVKQMKKGFRKLSLNSIEIHAPIYDRNIYGCSDDPKPPDTNFILDRNLHLTFLLRVISISYHLHLPTGRQLTSFDLSNHNSAPKETGDKGEGMD